MPIRLTTIAAAAFCAVLPLTAMAQATDSSGAPLPDVGAHTHPPPSSPSPSLPSPLPPQHSHASALRYRRTGEVMELRRHRRAAMLLLCRREPI